MFGLSQGSPILHGPLAPDLYVSLTPDLAPVGGPVPANPGGTYQPAQAQAGGPVTATTTSTSMPVSGSGGVLSAGPASQSVSQSSKPSTAMLMMIGAGLFWLFRRTR